MLLLMPVKINTCWELELEILEACIYADTAAYQHPESNHAYAIQAAMMTCISSPHACIVPSVLWRDWVNECAAVPQDHCYVLHH